MDSLFESVLTTLSGQTVLGFPIAVEVHPNAFLKAMQARHGLSLA